MLGSWGAGTLTGVGHLEPGRHQQHAPARVRARVEAVLGAVRGEHVRHRKDEAQQPRHQDGQDDLGERSREG